MSPDELAALGKDIRKQGYVVDRGVVGRKITGAIT